VPDLELQEDRLIEARSWGPLIARSEPAWKTSEQEDLVSVPAPPEPRTGRWETIRYALDSNARTFRLCLIRLASGVPVCGAAIELLKHVRL